MSEVLLEIMPMQHSASTVTFLAATRQKTMPCATEPARAYSPDTQPAKARNRQLFRLLKFQACKVSDRPPFVFQPDLCSVCAP